MTTVDINVGHVKHYQRILDRKCVVNGKQATKSNNYVKTRAKLQRDYRKVTNIQHDIMQKFTTKLVKHTTRS